MLLPFTLKQMRASPALMSEWRLATRRAAMQHAQAGAQAPAGSLVRPQHAALAAAQSTAAWAAPDKVPGRPAAVPADLAQQGAVTPGAGNSNSNSSRSSIGHADTVQQSSSLLGMHDSSSSSIGVPRISHKQNERSGSDANGTFISAPAAGAAPNVTASAQHDDHHDDSKRQNEDGSRPYQAPAKGPSLKNIMEEYRRVRGSSSAPGPAWLIGGPLLQVRQYCCLWHSCNTACAPASFQDSDVGGSRTSSLHQYWGQHWRFLLC